MKCTLTAHQAIVPNITSTIYCGQHLDLLSNSTEITPNEKLKEVIKIDDKKCNQDKYIKQHRGRRIPCPIDPSHSIYESNLKRHVKICPRAKELKKERNSPFYSFNVNRGGHGTTNEISNQIDIQFFLSNIFQVYFQLFIERSSRKTFSFPNSMLSWDEIYDSIPLYDLSIQEEEKGLLESIQLNRIKTNGSKNITQLGSIIGNLERTKLFPSSEKRDRIVLFLVEEIRPAVTKPSIPLPAPISNT